MGSQTPLYSSHVDAGARIVDSADTTARVVSDALAPIGTEPAGGDGGVTLLATDGVVRFRRVGRHFLGTAIESVELVDL